MPIHDIMAKHDVTETTIYRALSLSGLEPARAPRKTHRKGKKRRLNDTQISAINTMLDLGVSKSKIARTLNVSRSTIYRNIDEAAAQPKRQHKPAPGFLDNHAARPLHGEIVMIQTGPSLIRRIMGWFGF